ncbi:hypothetical protein E2C01_098723 [Portunus trituberculatus]|uniref:Uncharacterized protein n=1 Tax=Portunus trituberculatus TaxID=210409 RepID=A0A5B7KEW1_PORTR|nr:hypothetical protein [Portunus trituberculatus]
MNMPAVDSAPPMRVVILMPRESVSTPASTEKRKVDPMASDIIIAAGGKRRGENCKHTDT